MRFGIMSMQIEMLVPSELRQSSPEQALEKLLSFNQTALVQNLAKNGFKTIELGGDLAMILPQTFAPPTIDSLKSLQDELGLQFTVHLPLWSVEPSALIAPVRAGSVQALVDIVRATLPLKPEMYVLHATGALAAEFYRMNLPDVAKSLMLRQFQQAARQSICTLLEQTGLASRRLAIETIQFPLDLTLELAEELDLSICFDTGHVLVGFSGRREFFESLELCLPRLGEIHLHDGPWQGVEGNIGYGKDHQPLGMGDLETEKLLSRLEKAGFNGPLIFELRLDQALASLEIIRSIRPDLIT